MNDYIRVEIIDGIQRLVLDTGMNEKTFAQSTLRSDMQQPSILYNRAENTFTQQMFDGACLQNRDGRKTPVMILYSAAFSGTLLKDIFEHQPAAAYKTVLHLARVFEQAEKQNITLPCCGSAGTVCAENGDILFMAESVIARTLLQHSSADYAHCYCQYRNPQLSGSRSTTFTLGAYMYRALCGTAPFSGTTETEVYTNQTNSNFINPEYAAPGLTAPIARCITSLLDQQPVIVSKKTKTEKEQTPVITLQNIRAVLPADKTDCFTTLSTEQTNVLQQKAATEWKSQQKRTQHLRFLRKHKTHIAVIAGAAAAVIMITASIAGTMRAHPTTKGMEPQNVIERYYTSISALDQQWPDACCSRSADNQLRGIASTVYVTYRQTEFYAKERRIYTPGQWWTLSNPGQSHMFGITRLTVTESESPSAENKTFTASYYLVLPEIPKNKMPEDPNADTSQIFPLTVYQKQDTVEVTFKKDKWIITKITEKKPVPVPADYHTLCSVRTAGIETPEICWSPSQDEINYGEQTLKETYFN